MNKEEALEKYKEHLRDNVTYMGVGSMVLELLDNNKVANFAISSLAQEVYGLEEQNKKLKEALRFYADTSNWIQDCDSDYSQFIGPNDYKIVDGEKIAGERARAVLKEVENV